MNKRNKKINYIIMLILCAVIIPAAAAVIWYITAIFINDPNIKIAILTACLMALLGIMVFFGASFLRSGARHMMQETYRFETRPILSYLGRVLTKTETSAQPKAEAIINNMLLSPAASKNVKMSLDTAKKGIVPYEAIVDSVDHEPIIIVRPFIFANYGKGIAVGLNLSLDGKTVSFRSDYVIEHNAKIQLEINDTIAFNKHMGYFTMSYFDVYGNEYSLQLDGEVEYAKEESSDLDRDVYFFYVDGFSEIL